MDHHRHGQRVAEDQRLLLGLQPGQHRPQLARPGRASEHRVDVALVVQQAGQPGADLAHHLFVDGAGPLVDDHQGHVALAVFPGDGPESCLGCHRWVEKLVGLFYDDHQRPRFLACPALGFLLSFHVQVVYAPGQEIAYQHVGRQVGAVLTELQDDVQAAVQVLYDVVGGVPSRVFHQEPEPLEPAEPVVKGGQGVGLHLNFGCQVEYRVPSFQIEKAAHPFLLAELLLEVEGG